MTRTDLGIGETTKNMISLFSEISSWAQKKPEASRGKEGQWKHGQEDSSQWIVHNWANRNVTPLGVNGHVSIFFEFCSKVSTEQVQFQSWMQELEKLRVVRRPDWRGPKPIGFGDRDGSLAERRGGKRARSTLKPVYNCCGMDSLMGRQH